MPRYDAYTSVGSTIGTDILLIWRPTEGRNRTITMDNLLAGVAGGSPAGDDTELQFKDGTSFGAIPGSSWDGTSLTLPNNGVINGSWVYDRLSGNHIQASGVYVSGGDVNGVQLADNLSINWSTNSGVGGPSDTFLRRDSAGVLAQRNGTAGQIFNVYNKYTDPNNGEHGIVGWVGNVFEVGTQQNGTGLARDMRIGTSGINASLRFQSGGQDRWIVNDPSGGCLWSITDGTLDIGDASDHRPRDINVARNVAAAGSVFAGSVYINGVANLWSYTSGRIVLANTSNTDFDMLQFGGVTDSFPALRRSGTTLEVVRADGSAVTDLSCRQLYLGSYDKFAHTAGGFQLSPDSVESEGIQVQRSNYDSSRPSVQIVSNNADFGWVDMRLMRGGAGIFEQRNGTNAQTFNLYHTFTDESNYRRGGISWPSYGNMQLGVEAAGSESGGDITVNAPDHIYLSSGGAIRWQLHSGGSLLAWSDGAYDIGSSGGNRPNNVYVADTVASNTVTTNHINVQSMSVSGIPMSDPGLPGTVWNDGGTLKVSI